MLPYAKLDEQKKRRLQTPSRSNIYKSQHMKACRKVPSTSSKNQAKRDIWVHARVRQGCHAKKVHWQCSSDDIKAGGMITTLLQDLAIERTLASTPIGIE